MRISDWSSDVCSSDLARRSSRVSGRRCRADGARTGSREDGKGQRHGPSRRRYQCNAHAAVARRRRASGHPARSEEHTSELQSLMRISYAVFCLKKKKNTQDKEQYTQQTITTCTNCQYNT